MSKKFNCIYCDKNFSTKANSIRHMENGCKNIKNNNIKDLLKEIYLLKTENTELKNDLIDSKNKISSLETEVKLLRETKEEIKSNNDKQFDTISEIAKQPKNNSNNILNYKNNNLLVSFDLCDFNTITEIENKLCNTLQYRHLLDGQKSVAKFVNSCILLNDEGKNEKYICSDPSRGTFRFKDKDGNVVMDIKALKLSRVVYKAISQRVLQIKDDFSRDDSKDAFDINYLNKNIELIMNLINDNTDFRNEMINLSNQPI